MPDEPQTLDPSQIDDDLLYELYVNARIERAQGEGVAAVMAFGEHVFGQKCPAHVQLWLAEIFENKRVAIVAPPASTKTTWISVILTAWWIGKHPETMNLLVSVSDDQAQKAAAGVADCIEHNPNWRQVFPDVVPDKEKGWSRDGYYVKHSGYDYGDWQRRVADRIHPTLSAGGVGSALVIGKRVTGLLVSDDLHDVVSKSSDAVRDKTIEFFKTTLSSRPTASAHMVTVGTRWHPRDIFAHIAGTGLYKTFVHPAIVEGESYWPSEWTVERLEEKRLELGTVDFRLMYLADPEAAQGRLLKADWLLDFPAEEIKSTWPSVYGVDPAFKKLDLIETGRRKRSRFAIDHYKIAPFGLVLADVWAGHWTEAEAEAELERHAGIDHPKRIEIETNGVGDPFYQSLLRRTKLPLVPILARRDTVGRANEMAPDWEFGRVRLSNAQTPGLKLFRDEWLTLGEAGASDDTLSAAYYGWRAGQHALWRETASRETNARAYRSPFADIHKAYAR